MFLTNFVESKRMMEEIKKILSAANHKPFFKESPEHQKFIAAQIKKIDQIKNKFPFINLTKERESLA